MLHLRTLHAEEWRGEVAVKLDAEVGDVAVGTDLIVLDVDRAHDLVERCVGKIRSLADRSVVHLRPEHFESLSLGDPPSGEARALRIRPADVDMNAGDLERVR